MLTVIPAILLVLDHIASTPIKISHAQRRSRLRAGGRHKARLAQRRSTGLIHFLLDLHPLRSRIDWAESFIPRPCLISIFKFPLIQLFDRSEVLNGSGHRTGVVAESAATLGTCLRWPFFLLPQVTKNWRKREDQKNFCSLEMVSEGARLDKVKSSEPMRRVR